jgi:hypothetical protein
MRRGKQVVEILHDHQGIDDARVLVDQGRYQSVGVDCQVFRCQLITRPQVEDMLFKVLPFRVEGKADLMTANRLGRVVELKFRHVSGLA